MPLYETFQANRNALGASSFIHNPIHIPDSFIHTAAYEVGHFHDPCGQITGLLAAEGLQLIWLRAGAACPLPAQRAARAPGAPGHLRWQSSRHSGQAAGTVVKQ
eukprot:1079573-Pelagomonas_calceolata.AAC.14